MDRIQAETGVSRAVFPHRKSCGFGSPTSLPGIGVGLGRHDEWQTRAVRCSAAAPRSRPAKEPVRQKLACISWLVRISSFLASRVASSFRSLLDMLNRSGRSAPLRVPIGLCVFCLATGRTFQNLVRNGSLRISPREGSRSSGKMSRPSGPTWRAGPHTSDRRSPFVASTSFRSGRSTGAGEHSRAARRATPNRLDFAYSAPARGGTSKDFCLVFPTTLMPFFPRIPSSEISAMNARVAQGLLPPPVQPMRSICQ